MATKTEKAEKKASKKAQKNAGAEAPANAIPAQGDAAPADVQATAVVKVPRIKKNATQTNIDFAVPGSASVWLSEFYAQSAAQPPRKGYDQHWNKDGFIHAGPADRLPPIGCVKMGVFIGDMLAKQESDGKVEAGQALDFLINFLQTRRETLQTERNEAILAQADAIRAAQNAVPAAE